VHRSLEITVDPSATDELAEALLELDAVIGLALHRGASLKPEGDVFLVQALNRGGDEVMRLVEKAREHGAIAVATGELTSIIDPERQERVADDIDQALWEETETTMRHQAQLSGNFLALMALGGVVATTGFASKPVPQAIAFIAASVIAPGFEPVAKLPLGLVLRRPDLLRRGLRSMVLGYVALVVAAALAYAFLRLTEVAYPTPSLLALTEVGRISHPSWLDLLKSAAAAAAGLVMLAARRDSVIAGPLIALVIIPAAALIGVAAAAGRPRLMLEGAERLAIDVVIIVLVGAVVLALKQALRHKRRPFI
jgi:hypothetical protein